MQSKKHIVILTTWFPPISGVAVNRMLAFAKYLDHERYHISVVTLKTDEGKSFENLNDINIYRLENKVRFELPQFNSKDSKLKHKIKVAKKLLILKIQKRELVSWQKLAEKKVIEIHQLLNVDVILSSFSPAAPHVVAANVVSTFRNIKWIADMRDEMSENNALPHGEKAYLQRVERSVNDKATAVITVSLPIVEYSKVSFPSVKYVEEVRNGYDHNQQPNSCHFNSVFTMVYAGSFYGKRKPDTFFEALLRCKAQLPEKWKLLFVGTIKNFKIPREFTDNIEFVPRVPQEKSIEYMRNSDVNIIIHPAEKRKGVFTGKLFDYASVERPILGIIDEHDVAAKLINEMNLGFVANFTDVDKIQEGINKVVELWENKVQLKIDHSEVRKLHRKFQVEKLSNLIDQILSTN